MATESGSRRVPGVVATPTELLPDTHDARSFANVREAALRSLAHRGEAAHKLAFGSTSVLLRFAGDELVAAFLPALANRPVGDGPVDLEVVVWDSALSAVGFPPLEPGRSEAAARRGGDRAIEKVYQRGVDTFTAIDHAAGTAVVWVPDARTVPTNEIACPLRMLIHLWGRRRGLHLLHGGAVGTADGGVLIAGRSGIGKSTVALSCLGTDLGYAGDDYVLVDASADPVAYAVYTSGKLQPDQLLRFDHLAPARLNPGSDDKPVFLFAQTHASWLSDGFPLRAVVVPRITGSATPRLVPASAATAISNIAPSTVFQLPYSGPSTMAVAAALAKRLPTFFLEMGPEIDLVPPLLLDWIRSSHG